MVHYDPDVIRQFSTRLYSRANRMIFTYAVAGLLVGAVIGGLFLTDILPPLLYQYNLYYIVTKTGISLKYFSILVGALVFGLIGYAIGSRRAFMLKLRAQLALCQVEIEHNTRQPDR